VISEPCASRSCPLHREPGASAEASISANRIQIRRRRSPSDAWIAVPLQEIVIRRCAGDSRRALKSRILNTKMVGGEGFEPSSSRSRTVSMPCPPVSDRLPRRPREYEIDQVDVLW
jgi:hypothetical protein